MPEVDFGQYLVSVAERDIDLLLMEEFHISDSFLNWFCGRLGLSAIEFTGAWHSVSDTDGETDLLLRVTVNNRRIGILIENKIAAPEQYRQADRYHVRGSRSRDAGKFDDYMTAIFAPQQYLDALPLDRAYQHRISYESIATWFSSSVDRRSTWRNRIILAAIEQSRRGYTMLVDEARTAFHLHYWEYIQERHPSISMRRPTDRGGKSNWIIMKGHDFPPDVKLHHKFDQRTIELGFERRRVEDLRTMQAEWPEGIVLVQKGGTASLVTKVPEIDMKAGVQPQTAAIEQALASAYRLMPFARLFSKTGNN